jgi:hypothetical protein
LVGGELEVLGDAHVDPGPSGDAPDRVARKVGPVASDLAPGDLVVARVEPA